MRLATILLLATCGSTPDAPVAAVSTGCLPAHEPADLVVQITRSTLPIGGSPTEERGAVTHTGVCPAKVACKTIDAATMAKIWDELSRAATIDHGPPSSPHYGGRWIEVTWTGGTCELADSQQTPVTSASAQRFDAAYDAVAQRFATPSGNR